MNSGQVVDRNDADQHGWQFDQVPFLAFRGCKLGLASTKVAAAAGNLLYALAGAHRNVLHLDRRVALVVLLRPLVVERSGNTRSSPDHNNGFLSRAKRVTETHYKNQRKYPQYATSAGTFLRGHWCPEFCFGFHRGASKPSWLRPEFYSLDANPPMVRSLENGAVRQGRAYSFREAVARRTKLATRWLRAAQIIPQGCRSCDRRRRGRWRLARI